MNDNKPAFSEKPACSETYIPIPEYITCPKCGEDIELWSDEEETLCIACGYKVFKRENTVH